MNLEGAPVGLKDEIAADPVASSFLGGTNLKNCLSAGISAMPVDSDGVPFDMSHVYASGNIAEMSGAQVIGPVRQWQSTRPIGEALRHRGGNPRQ